MEEVLCKSHQINKTKTYILYIFSVGRKNMNRCLTLGFFFGVEEGEKERKRKCLEWGQKIPVPTPRKKNKLLMDMKKYSQDVSGRTYLFVQFIS